MTASAIPSDAVPVLPTPSGHFLRVNRLNPQPEPPQPMNSFQDHVDSLIAWKRELLQGVFQANELDSLIQHFFLGTPLLLCSDGGAKHHAGSVGWVIATANKFHWGCSGTATGWFANSFRSEGIGQLALLESIETFVDYCQLHDIPLPQLPPDAPWIASQPTTKD